MVGTLQIEIIDLLLQSSIALLIKMHKHEEGAESILVVLRFKKSGCISNRCMSEFLRHGAYLRNANPAKAIPLTVFARASLKEPL